MEAQGSGTEVLRFEIPVSGEAYRSLVSGLRGSPLPRQPGGRPPRGSIRAHVDLDLSSRQFSVTALGRHRLPSALEVKPGSRTHDSLSRLIARSVQEELHNGAASLLKGIIDAAPQLQDEGLLLRRQDLEIRTGARLTPAISPLLSVRLLSEVAPTLSLELDEAPTLVIADSQDALLARASSELQAALTVLSPLSSVTTGNVVTLRAALRVPELAGLPVDVFVHWGSYEDLAPAWQDEQATIQPGPRGELLVTHRLHIPTHGSYGATIFAQVRGSHEQAWIGGPSGSDARFSVLHDDFDIVRRKERELDELDAWCHQSLLDALSRDDGLEEACAAILRRNPRAPLGELLARAEASGKQSLGAACSARPLAGLAGTMRANFGIGEVVFATPEGPHAAAGGLAQVISGLPPELARAGIPTTIISPLYRYAHGNKHGEAQQVLTAGVKLGDATVKPALVGSVTVHVGPTVQSGTGHMRRAPSAIHIKVYEASNGPIRMFLLSNPSVFDRLYQPVHADEQLRRAIILSRATLEVIATRQFGIRPSALISNDWLTACVPAFCALDERYRSIPWLASCKTIHMIHNGGADYHGRLPNNTNGEDLWPMFNLAPEHFFGFRDPHNYGLLNFSMAAAQHASGGILTVSRPYAEQLLTHSGGDGLEHVLVHKRDRVFGISNGISRPEIDRYLSLVASRGGAPFGSTTQFLEAKQGAKLRIQERYGLAQSPNARLISFVGRMAEQKGLSLLSGFVPGRNCSTLEDLLSTHPDIQVLVAGPMTEGDPSAAHLRGTLDYLAALYPGRIRAVFDYVPHSTALEIIFGSTFFLMPSRFEPGGITQLEALAAGTLVIGRNVGGISASICNFDPSNGAGNGFLCNDYDPGAFANTCHWALSETRNAAVYRELVSSALAARHSWSDRVDDYRTMLQAILVGEGTPQHVAH